MEADWEFEVGGDAPIIDAQWPGFVDLREAPHRVAELKETEQLPGLADALVRLNAANSSVWTSKTDVFDPGQIDPDELDATREDAQHAVACYIDLLMRGEHQWSSPLPAEKFLRSLCGRLRAIPLGCCRIDLVIRRALIGTEGTDLGTTAYFTACGRSEADARTRLGESLAAFTEAIVSALE